MLLLQLDAALFDDLNSLIQKNYDYVGAPWLTPIRAFKFFGRLVVNSSWSRFNIGRKVWVGNGGLSLRKIDVMRRVTSDPNFIKNVDNLNKKTIFAVNEDALLSIFLNLSSYAVPSRREAKDIFVEQCLEDYHHLSRVLGVHAIEKFHYDEALQAMKEGLYFFEK